MKLGWCRADSQLRAQTRISRCSQVLYTFHYACGCEGQEKPSALQARAEVEVQVESDVQARGCGESQGVVFS